MNPASCFNLRSAEHGRPGDKHPFITVGTGATGFRPSRRSRSRPRAAGWDCTSRFWIHNVRTDDFEPFAVSLLRRLGRPITLVMDRLAAHHSAAKRLKARFGRRVAIEWLPPYAPDLNPDEQVWQRAKHVDLANFLPADVDELREALAESLERTHGQQGLLRPFFRHASLPLCCELSGQFKDQYHACGSSPLQ